MVCIDVGEQVLRLLAAASKLTAVAGVDVEPIKAALLQGGVALKACVDALGSLTVEPETSFNILAVRASESERDVLALAIARMLDWAADDAASSEWRLDQSCLCEATCARVVL